jgi:hypothetical protein
LVLGLVPPEEEKRIYAKLVGYYQQLYPGVKFAKQEKTLTRREVGEMYYTYCGEETEATALEKMRRINSAIGEGYSTPLIVLVKKKKLVLLDGHRRARVAFAEGIGWPALLIVPGKDVKYGIEGMILGRIRDLYGK